MRTTISALVAAAALTFAAPALADTTYSSNWSGYAVHAPGVSYREVSGSWRQPDVTCTRGSQSYSASWVGLGGYSETSNALEQIGTEADCNSQGQTVNGAWYELVPNAVDVSMPVRPGDTIAASVAISGHRVVLTLADLTRGRGFSKTLVAGSVDISSAEWIVEAPSDCLGGGCTILPLANFGSAGFTSAVAQSTNGVTGSISAPGWGATKLDLTPNGRRFVSLGASAGVAAITSALRPPGTSFKVTYERAGAQASRVQYASPNPVATLAGARRPTIRVMPRR